MNAFAGHRDERRRSPAGAIAEIRAELHGARRERSGLRALDQREHLGDVGRAEPHERRRPVRRSVAVATICREFMRDRDLPVGGHVTGAGRKITADAARARRAGASASQASGADLVGQRGERGDVGPVAQRQAAALGELGLRAGQRVPNGVVERLHVGRWCHGDARRAHDFRPLARIERRRLHDRRGRDRARARRRRCATRSGGWSASCTSSRRAPPPRATRRGACTTCWRRTPCSRRCRCIASVLPIVERVLDRGCLLSGMTAIDIGPGENAQPMHGDDIVMSRHLQRPHAPMMVTSMWALDDFTAANGGTRFVPGSHRVRGDARRTRRARRRRACARSR